MSATLVMLAFEPFLFALFNMLDLRGDGLGRACVDDVACLLRHIHMIRVVYATLRAAELAANLRVQPLRCVLIPVGRRCDLATVAMIRDMLVAHAPSWPSFWVMGHGTLLGVVIGPDAALHEWSSTLTKLTARAKAIAAGRRSPAVGALLYARAAVPMVHHVSQVCLPPRRAAALDLHLPARVLHLLGSPMPINVLLQLKKLGGPAIPSLLASMVASHVRHALSAPTDIDGALNIFAMDADELPLAWRPFGSPRHWKGECMVGEMRKTLDGDFAAWPRRLRDAVRDAVIAARAALAAGQDACRRLRMRPTSHPSTPRMSTRL